MSNFATYIRFSQLRKQVDKIEVVCLHNQLIAEKIKVTRVLGIFEKPLDCRHFF